MQMDVRDMSAFESDSFGAIIDKGMQFASNFLVYSFCFKLLKYLLGYGQWSW